MTEEFSGQQPPAIPPTAGVSPPAPPLPASVTQEAPVVKKRRGRKAKTVAPAAVLGGTVRVRPVHPYTINIHTQGIVIPPSKDAPVELDDFVQSQLDAGVLELSQ